MKTQILRLEPHDDLVSVRDKMKWGQTGRILLVWPGHGRILTRRLDLTLVQRQAAAQGAQLALVTTDPEVRDYARELGIPVYARLKHAQHDHWRAPRKVRLANRENDLEKIVENRRPYSGPPEPPPRPRPGPLDTLPMRLGIFAVGVLALLVLGATLIPGGTISLDLERRRQSLTLEVTADPQAGAINFSGIVPARPVEVIVEGRETAPSEGKLTTPDSPAAGWVRFTNLTDQALKIPAGSVARTPDEPVVRVATLADAALPAGPGTSVLLEVRAIEPGSRGNLEANRLTAVEGQLGTLISATNPQPTRNGSDRTLPAPASSQRNHLEQELLSSLRHTALAELQGGLQPGDLLLPGSLALSGEPESTFDPPLSGDPADELGLNLQAAYTALVISASDLEALASGVLQANLPQGYLPVRDTLSYRLQGDPERSAGGQYQLALQISWQVQMRVSPEEVVRLAAGQKPGEAQERLADHLLMNTPARVQVEPGWWPRLPLAPFRIRVQGLE